MGRTAAYDAIADWYEKEFLGVQGPDGRLPGGDPLGIDHALAELLGPGSGPCLEIGCGTGVRAARLRALGWSPAGVDLSAGMGGTPAGGCPRCGPMPCACRCAAIASRPRSR